MKYLRDQKNLKGVKVLMRVDFNVPVQNGKVVDDFRIKKIMPTLKYLQDAGARIILMSHMEMAASSKTKEKPSLRPVVEYLKGKGVICDFVENYRNALGEIEKLGEGQVILLENLRMNPGETKNDKDFAKELASLADIYVNEAFAVSHREHASVAAITEFIPSYAGLLFEQEVKHLSSAFNPDHPFLFVLSGAKFETKLPLIEKFMGIADKVFVGGALANNFFKEMGRDIGDSLVSPENFKLDRFFNSPKLLLPIDSIKKDNAIQDAGPETVKMLEKEVMSAKYILWNGPLGAYETGYKEPTLELARTIAKATENGAKSILGGGDTLATIAELGTEDKYTFVSTGGGAMLEFLAQGTLPGVEALEKSTA
jgi:phosphoglycerate kinase